MERRVDRKEMFRQRTKKFASEVIRFYCELPKARLECQVLGKQLLRSGTSVAANYREASRARSNPRHGWTGFWTNPTNSSQFL